MNISQETPTSGQNKDNKFDGTTDRSSSISVENKVYSDQTPRGRVATADETPPAVPREKIQSLIRSLSEHVKHSPPTVPPRRSKTSKGAKKRERRLSRLQSTGKLASFFGQIREENAGTVSCAETAVIGKLLKNSDALCDINFRVLINPQRLISILRKSRVYRTGLKGCSSSEAFGQSSFNRLRTGR